MMLLTGFIWLSIGNKWRDFVNSGSIEGGGFLNQPCSCQFVTRRLSMEYDLLLIWRHWMHCAEWNSCGKESNEDKGAARSLTILRIRVVEWSTELLKLPQSRSLFRFLFHVSGVMTIKSVPTLRRNVVPPSSVWKSEATKQKARSRHLRHRHLPSKWQWT